jgi:hypothetical protein
MPAMTDNLPDTIQLAKTILSRLGEADIAGDSYVDDQGRWIVELGLMDEEGSRDLKLIEGDTFDFVGRTWKVSKVYEPSIAERGPVAKLTRV